MIGASIAGVLVVGLFGLHFYLRASVARYRAELVRKGEKLKLSELLPKAVAPESNGAPALKMAAAQLPRGTPAISAASGVAMRLFAPGRAGIAWQRVDLRTRSSDKTNTWEELAEELQDGAVALDDVRAALQQPEFDFNVNYLQGTAALLPHLAPVRTVAQVLSTSTLLHLHEGKLDLAFKDLQAQLALCRTLESERFMISQLVRIAYMNFALRTTWEALQAEAWTDAQLLDLEQRWEKLHFLEPCAVSLEMERAMMLQAIGQARESATAYQNYFGGVPPGGGSTTSSPLEAMTQSARVALGELQSLVWRNFSSYDDERRYLVLHQVILEASRQPTSGRFYASEQKRLNDALAGLNHRQAQYEVEVSFLSGGFVPYHLPSILTESSLKLNSKAFAAETQRDLAVVAIAIKRYQLRHGKLPPSLEVLAPEFLGVVPLDRMDGKPLRYRVNGQAGFMLYSVGSDGTDNGGDGAQANGPSPTTPPQNWLSGKDWVWPQPASRQEIEKYNTAMGEETHKRWNEKNRKRKEGN